MSEMSHRVIYVERGWGWESVGSAGLMKTLFKEISFVNCNLLTITISGPSIFSGIRWHQMSAIDKKEMKSFSNPS